MGNPTETMMRLKLKPTPTRPQQAPHTRKEIKEIKERMELEETF
jgi:hypothetical protein